ncbi:hypothetical protein ANCDUO_13512, partial [Ancylostoma duodenale]
HTEDKDSGDNARVRYSVDNDNFTINDQGELSAKNRLDADQFKERFFIYRFNVTATDFGNPPLSSNATVSSVTSILPFLKLELIIDVIPL